MGRKNILMVLDHIRPQLAKAYWFKTVTKQGWKAFDLHRRSMNLPTLLKDIQNERHEFERKLRLILSSTL